MSYNIVSREEATGIRPHIGPRLMNIQRFTAGSTTLHMDLVNISRRFIIG
jgi:hypothetical protein